jgi:predicted SAM-dependent methyltransferase
MERITCAICNSKLENIKILENVPINLTCYSKPIYESSELSVSKCITCNTIQLDKLIPLNILYGGSHNYTSYGKVWEKYFDLFVSYIKSIVINKNILEIGDPSGKIALKLNDYNKWFIVEKNKNDKINFNEKITFIEQFFDDDFIINDKIDIIVHSHLFEHIYEPNKFLEKCYDILNDNGEMFFGVPNMQHFTETNICPFLGLFFEHTIFLNKENITYLLNKNNFEIIKIIDYEKHSTIYHCKKIIGNNIYNNTNITNNFTITNYYDNFEKSIVVYNEFLEKCNNIIINTNKDVYIFGASYNNQLLISFGLDMRNVKGFLDNCKEKQGKFLHGYDVKIYDPNIIKNKDCIIILKNGYYTNEILKQIYELNVNTEVII